MKTAVNLHAKKFRSDPDLKTCMVRIDEIGFGIWQYTVWSKRASAPIAMAWVDVKGGKPCIGYLQHIYVHPYYRRFGVGRLIFTTIMQVCDRVETGVGSTEGGFALIKSLGFIPDPRRGGWFVEKKK